MQKMREKLNANAVGASIARPHFIGMTLKKQKGITLIALIITIIVMLILVGVTINVALNGGLFQKAEEAKTQTQKVADDEELQLEIITAYNEKEGTVDLDLLKTNLEAKKWNVTKSGDKLICTSAKGNTFTVTADGKITEGGTNTGGGNGETPAEGTRLISMYRAGENCTETNCTDEGHLHIGDYVSYNPDTTVTRYYPDGENETNIGTNTGYITSEGATSLQVVEQEDLNWRVLGASGDNVLLISGAPTTTGILRFYGHVGYNNYENILNTACSTLYSKSGIGTARSITMSDIDNYLDGSNYDKTTFDQGRSSGYYGYTNSNITSNFDYNSSTNTLTKLAVGETKTLLLTSNMYYYTASEYITNPIKLNLLQGDSNYRYWVASRAVHVNSYLARWCYASVDLSDGTGPSISVGLDKAFYDTIDGEFSYMLSLRPVITLSSEVTTEDISKE
ncbi:MAG: hypothetical protein IJB90_04245 [Clostridia bacterium]|nr:hypothetical protein [Clostridia bacterium]